MSCKGNLFLECNSHWGFPIFPLPELKKRGFVDNSPKFLISKSEIDPKSMISIVFGFINIHKDFFSSLRGIKEKSYNQIQLYFRKAKGTGCICWFKY